MTFNLQSADGHTANQLQKETCMYSNCLRLLARFHLCR